MTSVSRRLGVWSVLGALLLSGLLAGCNTGATTSRGPGTTPTTSKPAPGPDKDKEPRPDRG